MARPAVVSAVAVSVSPHLVAFAEEAPIALARLRAAEPGVVRWQNVLPGAKVSAGEMLGRLGGPEIAAKLAAEQATLAAERHRFAAHLATADAFARAKAALAATQAGAILVAPAAGTVAAVSVADGERVSTGETLLSVVPAGGLWIRAVVYGAAAALQPGMSGRFTPADGSAAFPVTVASVLPVVRPDGGMVVGLRPSVPTPLVAGRAGQVVLKGKPREMVAVPTRALILSRGRWWVLVRTPAGDRRRAVIPGPERGGDTLISAGLVAGAEVVVDRPYLRFHRGVAKTYQPPD